MNPTFVDLLESNAAHAQAFHDRFDDLQTGQAPEAVTVCCSDSRVLQDHLWGNDDPGRLFTVANIGNRVVQRTDQGTVVSGDVLYPLEHTGTEAVVVVGHTGCGAVTATYDAIRDGADEPPGIDHCLGVLRPDLEPGTKALPSDLDRAAAIDRLVEYNVDRQVDRLRESPAVPETVDVLGVVYDFLDTYPGSRGHVHVINVDGERRVEALRDAHPSVAERVHRLWEYA